MLKRYFCALLALALLLSGPTHIALGEAEPVEAAAVEVPTVEAPDPEAVPEAPAGAELPPEAEPEGPAEENPADPHETAEESPAPEATATAEPAAETITADETRPAEETEAPPAETAVPDEALSAPAPASIEETPATEASTDTEASVPEPDVPSLDSESEPAPVEPTSIAVKNLTLGVGQSAHLDVHMLPEGASAACAYATSAKKVAAVSASGVVTAKKAGTAIITVVTANGKKASCKVTVKAAPKAISLNVSSGTLGVGESYDLRYALTKKSAASVQFISSDPAVASVDPETGHVEALAPGSAVITARTHNGRTASCRVRVAPAPEAILLEEAALTVGQGQTIQLAARLNEGAAGRLYYASSDPSVAAVNGSGVVKGVSGGTATITVSTYVDGVTAEAVVTVVPAPDRVAIPAALTLGVKDTFQFVPEIPEGTMTAFAYTSNKTKVAAVSASGVVTAKKAGTAIITVVTANGKKASCKVTVKAAPKAISLNVSSGTLGVGESYDLRYALTKKSAASVQFISSDPAVASVDPETGHVEALAPGSAVITARTHNGRTASCRVRVAPAPEAILLEEAALTVGQGQTIQLAARLNEGAAGRLYYASSDPSVAAVNGSGVVKGVSGGTATITVSTYVDGVTAEAVVTVVPAPDHVTLPASLKIGVGDSYALQPSLLPADSRATLAFASSNTKIVKVSASGVITARAKGTATIAVKTHNGKTASCKVTVTAAPKKLTLSESALILGAGETAQLAAMLNSGLSGTIRYASSDPAVASVDAATGLVTALAPGQADIVAAGGTGLKAVCRIDVANAPDSIVLEGAAARELGEGQTLQLTASFPEGAHARIAWSSSDPAVAAVDDQGMVTGRAGGTATITAATYVEGVTASVQIAVWGAPQTVSLRDDFVRLPLLERVQAAPVLPEGTRASFRYASSNEGIASVDAEGWITGMGTGTAQIGVTTHNGKTAVMTVEVYDPYRPESISVGELPDLLSIGGRFQIECELLPAGSGQEMRWVSTDPAIASVDENGKITALSPGLATVTGASLRNSALRVECSFVVLSERVCLIIPQRRTGVDEIEANLERIQAIARSAYNELNSAYADGDIGKAEYTRRTSAIKNAFAMYAFPWMTENKMLYWREANSEEGAKDFKPGTVYYGIPYTQNNRNYNVTRLVDNGYYTKAKGGDYYLLNTGKVSQRAYKGNDCSSFVSMAYWGTNSDNSFLNTRSIASSTVYKTIPWDQPLRTGDLICKGGAHVVMFLYYVDTAKTQIMIIEQGGGGNDVGVNTVGCGIRTVARYRDDKYVIRRLVKY